MIQLAIIMSVMVVLVFIGIVSASRGMEFSIQQIPTVTIHLVKISFTNFLKLNIFSIHVKLKEAWETAAFQLDPQPFFGLDTGSARPVQAILDSFYSSVPGGMYQVWYEGWGLFSDVWRVCWL